VEDHGASKQADPLAKPGVIGAFCRAYPISELIPEFFSDVYAPTDDENRYDYIPADSPCRCCFLRRQVPVFAPLTQTLPAKSSECV
jgi:hypothetical protein